jgi:nicotinamide mononucleotide adenylyltransferase
MKQRALFIGRWQPFHPGHEWLVRQQLDNGVPVMIAVRPTNEWWTTEEVIIRIKEVFEGEDVIVFELPDDIGSVNYGRGVGYEIVEHVPPEDVSAISGTEIRNS